MAKSVTGSGIAQPSAIGAEGTFDFQFSLDGLATSTQMEKLIKLSEDLVKKLVGPGADSLKEFNESLDEAASSLDDLTGEIDKRKDAEADYNQSLYKATSLLGNIVNKNFVGISQALSDVPKNLTLFAGAIGFVYTGLKEYNKSLTEGLKRGIGGSLFDLAIGAKTAGLSLTSFNKAMAESGGGFAGLGDNATDGMLAFGRLVKSVRRATADVGNLGMTNDELAILTAQQTKIAISQGFKGKQAQDVVIRNTRSLGYELENLAERTGKSVLELAQAAAKLSQDPIVANFVRSAKDGSKEISAAVQSFAASMRGMFGEQGEKIAQDALQSAISGLPMIITQTGKNMLLAGSQFYNEFERQAQKARRGEKITDDDRARLAEMIKSEVKGRESQLAQFAMLGGPVGESAKQLLELARDAEFYNSEEGKRQRRQSDAAKRFNTELNQLQATLQELLIPVLQAFNAVDWATIFAAVSFIPRKIAEFIDAFRAMVNNLLPAPLVDGLKFFADWISRVVSLGAGFIVTVGVLATAYVVYKKALGAATTLLGSFGLEIQKQPKWYQTVWTALQTFTKALYEAATAAKVGGRTIIGGGPERGRPGSPPRAPGPTPEPGKPGAPHTPGPVILGPDGKPLPPSTPRTPTPTPPPVPPTPVPPTPAPPAPGGVKGALGKVGGALLTPKGMGIGLFAGLGADFLAEALGRETTGGKVADTAGSALGMAGTGAMIGTMIAGPIGTAVGAGVGALVGGISGVWKNFLSNEAGSISKVVKDEKMTAEEKSLRDQRRLEEQNNQILQELRRGNEEVSYGNQINARGVSYAASSERKLSDLRFNQG